MEPMVIDVYPLQWVARPKTEQHRLALRTYAKNYVRYSQYWDKWKRKQVMTPEAPYVFFTKDRREVRGMFTMFEDLIASLKLSGLNEGSDFITEYHTLDLVKDEVYPKIKEGWSPRGEQQDVIDFVSQFPLGPSLLFLQTGAGKSITAMFCIDQIKQRFVGIMRPQFLGKNSESGWLKDFHKTYDLKPNEICRVQGRKALISLINICLEKGYNPYKALLLSNKTLMFYISEYEANTPENFKALGFNCIPQDLPKLLGVDTFVIDEAHFDHHLNCKMTSYFQLNRIMGATATPNPDNAFVDRMSKLLFPVERRYRQKELNVYIQPYAYQYSFENPNKIRTEGFRGYSHVAFEKSLMKTKRTTQAYFQMIDELIQHYHIPKLYVHPYRCLVTVATINMAYALTAYLKQKYPNKKVTSYVADDPVDNLYTSDICVSTILGSGTGHDISDLATVIMTNAINSTQQNLQTAGRLRHLNDKVEHTFVYLVCTDFMSHKQYDMAKRYKIFKDKTLNILTAEHHEKII